MRNSNRIKLDGAGLAVVEMLRQQFVFSTPHRYGAGLLVVLSILILCAFVRFACQFVPVRSAAVAVPLGNRAHKQRAFRK